MVACDQGFSGMMPPSHGLSIGGARFTRRVACGLSFLVVIFVVLRPHPETGNAWVDVFACDVVLAPIFAGLWGLQVLMKGFNLSTVIPVALVASLTSVIAFSGNLVGAQRVATLIYLVTALQSLLWMLASQPVAARYMRRTLHVAFLVSFMLAVAQAVEIDPFGAITSLFGQAKLKPMSSSTLRVFGSYYNANWAGCAACCWLSLVWLELTSESNKRALWVCLGLIALGYVAMTGSRSAGISTAVLLAFALAWLAWSRKRMAIVVLCIGATAALLSLAGDSGWIIDKFESTRWATIFQFKDQASFKERLTAWGQAIDSWRSSPYMGVGKLPEDQLPHNSLLSVLCSVGAVGAAAVLTSLVFIVRPYLHGRAPGLWWLGSISAIILCFSTGDFIWSTQVSLTVILLVCCGASTIPSRARSSRLLKRELKITAQTNLQCTRPSTAR